MRVLLVHNRYKIRAGEDQVFDRECALLREHGHAVDTLIVTNDGITGFWPSVEAAWNTAYSRSSQVRLAQAIAAFRPDIVHAHNTFPILTPSIYSACRDAGIPVVQTLHNYRLICAAATLWRDQHVCEDCLGASPYQAVLHSCYRGSRVGSLAVARMIDMHRRRGTWDTMVDHFLTPSAFARDRYVQAGFSASLISVKPNFLPDDGDGSPSTETRQGALYVGRLSAEKGVRTLLRAWRDLPDVPLTLLGDGPLRAEVDSAAADDARISVRGHVPGDTVTEAMRRAAVLIMPSEWYETFGLVIVEAFCRRLPVIACRLGAMAEVVDDGVTGFLFSPGDAGELARVVRRALANPRATAAMGDRARRRYEERYSPAAAIRALEEVYRQTASTTL